MVSGYYYNNTDSFQRVCVLLQTKTVPNSLVFVDGFRLLLQHRQFSVCLCVASDENRT